MEGIYTEEDIKRIDKDTDEYLKSIKINIKCLLKYEHNLEEAFIIIAHTFDDDFVSKYPEDEMIFNNMNLPEFNDWCEKNIEGYSSREINYDINYHCEVTKHV